MCFGFPLHCVRALPLSPPFLELLSSVVPLHSEPAGISSSLLMWLCSTWKDVDRTTRCTNNWSQSVVCSVGQQRRLTRSRIAPGWYQSLRPAPITLPDEGCCCRRGSCVFGKYPLPFCVCVDFEQLLTASWQSQYNSDWWDCSAIVNNNTTMLGKGTS